MVSRRSLLVGAAAAAGLVWAKPSDNGGNYSSYFHTLNNTLRKNGIDKPSLVIDLDRLDRNIDRVAQSVTEGIGRGYRVVVKSIPSPGLVNYVASRANTKALMVFHRPFVQAMAVERPDSDLLLGKPMPIAAAQTFYDQHEGEFNPEKQLQWLIDTDARLIQYLDLAKAKNLKLRINLELDVGLHRGGYATPEALVVALDMISANPAHLEFSGFMGYDAHVSGLPKILAKGELLKIKQRYASAVDFLQQKYPSLMNDKLCFNGAGSPTFRYYEDNTVVNEISAGSCLLKPTHFDLAILEDFEESSFIASPVLKRLQGGRLPAVEWAGPLIRGWDKNQAQTYFAYSGNWLADLESPPGLSKHFAYVSSNQQGYNASSSVGLDIDDFIFLRPTQSEAVLLEFGDLIGVRGNVIEQRWSVLPAGV
jgi:D-serine deaminase-like pyridoxal phosphate-dependent protein